MKLNSETAVLEATRLALSAMALEESVRLQMEAHGLTPPRRQKGITLLDIALGCQKNQVTIYDAQWSLSQQLNAQMDAQEVQFKEHVRVVRSAFRKQPEVEHSLKIKRFAERGWPIVRQAAYFYAHVLEQELNLQPYGISKKELEQAAASVNALLAMKEERTRKKGLAESCTQQKKAAFRELRQWVSEFRITARMAYRDNPQMLEMFGILVPTGV